MYNEDAPTTMAPAIGPCNPSRSIKVPLIRVETATAPSAPEPIPAIMQRGFVYKL